jgi:molecular chaperone HscA
MAEQAKKAMTTEDFFEEVFMEKSFQLDASTWISLSKKLVDQTIDSCKKALRDADLEIHNIDDVVLVGGSSRMPVVKQALHNFFGRKPNDQLNPDEVVALGAAIQADVLSGRNKETLLLDVTPLSLGIETVGGLMDVIIPRNSKIPNQSGRQYTTSIDGQVNLKVSVFQGERDLVKDNRKLGSFTLKGIPPMPAGLPKIEIHFILDADGILKVRAKELRSGVEQIVEVNSPYGLSEEEMSQMLIDSISHAKEDMKIKALIESRTEAKLLVQSALKFVEQNKDLFHQEELKQLQVFIDQLQLSTEGDEKDKIEIAMQELNDYSKPLAERAMDATIASAMKGKKL